MAKFKVTAAELEFLAAWAHEEWVPACYGLPAHRLQMANNVRSAYFIPLIKAWAESEGRKDSEIEQAAVNDQPSWPWRNLEEFRVRLEEAPGYCRMPPLEVEATSPVSPNGSNEDA